ncbi:YhdP family protein [Nitrosospira multiformis]|uniref:YhdP family protein n=1 Tax=Nitrosospira multiformis TaxID=1231 RepID=UPI00089BD116|nr:YhdP family protein [Nitrosospira multiformis]SEA09779.1 TIGR02099 family protein [Nitrosospira multiformis]
MLRSFLFRLSMWVLIAVAAVFSVLLLSLRYWLLPNIEQYRENLASAISHASGQYVTLGEISANWDGFRPHMMLRDVRVHDNQGVTLLLNRLEGTLSWRSILHGELLFREIAIDQPDLIVRRDTAGVIHVAGFALKQEFTESEDGFFDWLLNQRQVIINNANILWQDDQRTAPQLELLVNLRLENRGRHHRFGIRAIPPTRLAAHLDMRGDFKGESLANPGLWRGRLFMQITRADIAGWQAWLPFPEEIKLNRGVGALRIWANIDGTDMNKVTADMRLQNVKARLESTLPEVSLTRLAGRVGWHKVEDNGSNGSQFFARRLDAAFYGKPPLPLLDFSFQQLHHDASKPDSNTLSVQNLRLDKLEELAKYLPMSEPLRAKIRAVSPRGKLHSVLIKWTGEWAEPSSFHATGRFTKLGMKRSDGMPAFTGVSGNIHITEQGGTLNLDSQNTVLQLPNPTIEPVTLNTLAGQIRWNLTSNGSKSVKFSNISFSSAYAAGSAYGNYQTAPASPGILDLTTHLTRADIPSLLRLLPAKGKGREYLPDWLGESIVAGSISNGWFHLKGNLARPPFVSSNPGVFEFAAKISGMLLDPLPGWPRIENLTGTVLLNDKRMEINVSKGDILGARLGKARLIIPDMTATEARLKTELEATGATRQFLAFAAAKTPDTYDNWLMENTRIFGDGRLLLKLDTPLRGPGETRLWGRYQFMNNRIAPSSYIPELEQLNGTLTFTDSEIRTKNLSGRLLGGPVLISSTDMPGGGVRFSAIGKVDFDNLNAISQPTGSRDIPFWTRHIHGSGDWRAAVLVGNRSTDVSVESSLEGISSDLPEPLSKAAHDAIPVKFEGKATGTQSEELHLSYGERIKAKISRTRDDSGHFHVERGSIVFGPSPVFLPEEPGIVIKGALPVLNLDRWRLLLKQFEIQPAAPFSLNGLNLYIESLGFLGRQFDDVTLDANRKDGLWYCRITSEEVNGGITWNPSGTGKIVARLNRLIIPANPPSGPGTVSRSRQQEKDLPALDVIVDDFVFGEKQLGKLELVANQEERNWYIDKLHIVNPDSSIKMRGLWKNRVPTPQTQATVMLETDDIGKFLERLALPDRVTSGSGTLEGILSWQGDPLSIDYSTLSGRFKLGARRGQFPRFEPGIGRLFGIFNLRSLPRRITLDFRDVFSEGFGFDDISGSINIASGIASTDELKINGPAARVTMNGQMNLEAETQKLHIRVTPSYGLASPVVGMASVIASTAMKKTPAPSRDYNITGTWADPVVTRIGQPAQELAEPQP